MYCVNVHVYQIYSSDPSVVSVWYARSNNHNTSTMLYTAATGTTPHTATLVNPICAERFHRHYSGQPAL